MYIFDTGKYGILLKKKEIDSIAEKLRKQRISSGNEFWQSTDIDRYVWSHIKKVEKRNGKFYYKNGKRKEVWQKELKYGLEEFEKYIAPDGS